MATLRLFRSPPGGGKTTAAYRMFPGVFHVENDMYHMHDGVYDWRKESMPGAIRWCIKMVETALENKMDAVVCNTFTKKRYVKVYEDIAKKHGANFEVYKCIGHFKNVHSLPDNLVKQFEDAMEDWPGEKTIEPIP